MSETPKQLQELHDLFFQEPAEGGPTLADKLIEIARIMNTKLTVSGDGPRVLDVLATMMDDRQGWRWTRNVARGLLYFGVLALAAFITALDKLSDGVAALWKFLGG